MSTELHLSTLDERAPIPAIIRKLLPEKTLSVSRLVQSPIPASTRHIAPPLSQNSEIFSRLPSVFQTDPEKACTLLPTLHSPNFYDLVQLRQDAEAALDNDLKSVVYRGTTSVSESVIELLLPIWVLEFWHELQSVIEAQVQWKHALRWLIERDSAALPQVHYYQLAKDVLANAPWGTSLPSDWGGVPLTSFHRFCGAHWLNDENMVQLGAVLNRELQQKGVNNLRLETSWWWSSLLRDGRSYDSELYLNARNLVILRDAGSGLANREYTKLAFPVNVILTGTTAILPPPDSTGNHWVSVVIDVDARQVLYGDPMKKTPPEELQTLLRWWLEQHRLVDFTFQDLPCTSQPKNDTHSCGILSHNALAHHYIPEYPLLNSTTHDDARVLMLLKIIRNVFESLPPATDSPPISSEEVHNNPLPSSIGAPTSSDETQAVKVRSKAKPKAKPAPADSQSLAWSSKKGDGRLQAWDPISVAFSGEKRKRDEPEEEDGDDEEHNSVPPGITVIDAPKQRKNGASTLNKGGHPPDPFLKGVTVRCYRSDEPSKMIYRCRGTGCRRLYTKRDTRRVGKHAKDCKYLSQALRETAASKMMKEAPSVKLEEIQERETKKAKTVEDAPKVSSLHTKSKEIGKAQRHAKLNLAMKKLFCVAGLPMYLLSCDEFHEVLNAADNTYRIPARSTLQDSMIPGEQEAVKKKIFERLKQATNLTISFDGGTTKGREAFWTVSVSDPNTGRTYLVEGKEATNVSHTANWIEDLVVGVMHLIGIERFCSIVSDSTGNTRLARKQTVQRAPTIFNLPDICHWFSNTCKDIVKLDYFELAIQVVRATITFFHKSHLGIAELKKEREDLRITHGLESIGKTRFCTIIHAALSVQRCAPAIKNVVAKSEVNFDEEYKAYFRSSLSQKTHDFEFKLSRMLKIGLLIAKALHCLESNTANASDVYLLVHAVLFEIEEQLADEKNEFPPEVRAEVLGILNRRYRQIFDTDAPRNMASKAYLAAAYLNPNHIAPTADVFREEDTRNQSLAMRGIRHPSIFKEVAQYLCKTVAQNEINFGQVEQFTRFKGRADEFKTVFMEEFTAYARREYPYKKTCNESKPQAVLRWWRSIEGSELATVLPFMSIKHYSARVNSMAEERVVSNFTWYTPPERSLLKVETLVAMTQIRQYYLGEKASSQDKSTIHYRHVKNSFQGSMSNSDTNKPLHDDQGSNWLDRDTSEEDEEAPALVPLQELAVSLVNSKSSRVRSLLGEDDIPQRAETSTTADGGNSSRMPTVDGEASFDFTLDFEE